MSARRCESVLYIDDDPDVCEVVQATLSLVAGLDVHVAGSGDLAIDLAFELRPDLILMDVTTPGIDGPATFKRLRVSPLIASIPVIFLTANVLPSEVAHLLNLGAIGVIGKPFDPQKLGDELLALWSTTCAAGASAAAPSEPSEVKPQAESLADGFLQRSRGDAVRLRDLLERARRGDLSVLGEVERIAHSIHGAAAMFGFARLSVAGGSIERLVEGVLANTAADRIGGHAMLQQLLDHTVRLAQEVEAAGSAAPGGLFADHAGATSVRGRSN
jgi:CheY-like chemotaxis protein